MKWTATWLSPQNFCTRLWCLAITIVVKFILKCEYLMVNLTVVDINVKPKVYYHHNLRHHHRFSNSHNSRRIIISDKENSCSPVLICPGKDGAHCLPNTRVVCDRWCVYVRTLHYYVRCPLWNGDDITRTCHKALKNGSRRIQSTTKGFLNWRRLIGNERRKCFVSGFQGTTKGLPSLQGWDGDSTLSVKGWWSSFWGNLSRVLPKILVKFSYT